MRRNLISASENDKEIEMYGLKVIKVWREEDAGGFTHTYASVDGEGRYHVYVDPTGGMVAHIAPHSKYPVALEELARLDSGEWLLNTGKSEGESEGEK